MQKIFKANKYEIKVIDLVRLLHVRLDWVAKIKFEFSDSMGVCEGISGINLYPDKDTIKFWFRKPVTIIAENEFEDI